MSEIKSINGVSLVVAKNSQELSKIVAEVILEKIKNNPNAKLLVPTGTTPEGVYEILRSKDPQLFCGVTFFNMDEYCEKIDGKLRLVLEKDSKGYRYYMRKHFFEKIVPKATYFPGIENYKNPGFFDDFIKRQGGIDLCLSAVGEDGHIAFNFPGTSFDSVSRLVKLNPNIKRVNKKLTGLDVPNYGVTIGIKTEMDSKEIIFMVSGKRKAKILSKILQTKSPNIKIPATILKKHCNCHWFVDQDALSEIF